jgi:hypothetical protein
MSNPLVILQALDRHLDHPVELTLYGRAALALGFSPHLPQHETTQDVDAIIPLAQLAEHGRGQFRDLQQRTGRACDQIHAVETLIRQEAAEQRPSR